MSEPIEVPVFPEAIRAAIDADYAEVEAVLRDALDTVTEKRSRLAGLFALTHAALAARPLASMFVRIRPEPPRKELEE